MVNIVGETILAYTKQTVPIGFVYIQFPNKPAPSSIFTGTWTEIRAGSYCLGCNVDSAPYICFAAKTTSSAGNHCHVYCTSSTSSTAGAHTHSVSLVTSVFTGSIVSGTTIKAWKRTA